MSTIDALRLRRVMGRARFGPPEPFGPDGWCMQERETHPDGTPVGSVIVTCGPAPHSDQEWIHASIAKSSPDEVPSYADLVLLHHAVWGEDGWSYQVFAPVNDHVNIHPSALHLWGRADGAAVLPNFGAVGSI